MTTSHTSIAVRTPAQWAALVLGAVYLVVGVAGWFVTESFTGHDEDAVLLVLHVNGVHNVVHLALGLVWLGASTRPDWTRAVHLLFGAVLVLVAVVGLTGALDTLLNIEDAAALDNYVHLATGAVALWFGTAGARGRR